jgi:response regulator RpfG family c-di-GMP phosphodiesterase
MFKGLAAGIIFLLLFWARRRDQKAAAHARRMQRELADTQRDLERAQHKSQQLVGLLTELHEHKVSPVGRVAWSELAEFAVQTAAPLVGVETVILLQWDPQASEYRGLASRGLSPQQAADLRVRPGEGVLGNAAQGAKVLVVNEPAISQASQESFLSDPYLVLPLWVHSKVNGLFVFCKPQDGRFGAESMRLAALMAKQVQLTMENLDLYETRHRVYTDVVETLSMALGAKDPGSQRHAARCRELVGHMAREMNLPPALTEQMEYGAWLHDIGNLGLSDELLSRKGPLTEQDYTVVKKHPQAGYDILHGIGFFKGIAPIVLYHHEWVNGQGYPEGLAGEEIPLGARMLSIADAWDTMVNDQPYRKALPKNNAIAELRQQAGAQFDPKLVDVFLRVIDQLDRGIAVASAAAPNA